MTLEGQFSICHCSSGQAQELCLCSEAVQSTEVLGSAPAHPRSLLQGPLECQLSPQPQANLCKLLFQRLPEGEAVASLFSPRL